MARIGLCYFLSPQSEGRLMSDERGQEQKGRWVISDKQIRYCLLGPGSSLSFQSGVGPLSISAGGSNAVDKARQWLTRHWRQLPYHSTHGVMTLGHDGDAGSSVHFGDAIPVEMLSSSTHAQLVALALLCVADIRTGQSHPIASHPMVLLSLRLYHQAKHCWFRRCCFLLLVRLTE